MSATPDPLPVHGADRAQAPVYRLARHVRVCDVDGQAILLDLRSDRYVAFGGPALRELATSISDWPKRHGKRDPPGQPRALGPLLRNGWIVSEAVECRPDHLPKVVLPLADETLQRRPVRPTIGDAMLAACSAAAAALDLKTRSLLSIAEALAAERESSAVHMNPNGEPRLLDATCAYLHLRPLLYSARDRCLHDSLALTRFLSAKALSVHCVVGVRTRPFAAHAWVQRGRLVLNDHHERVRAYQPILVL